MKPYVIVSSIFLVSVTLFWCAPTAKKESTEAIVPTPAEMIKRGAYLVDIGGCNDCHTPKTMTPKGPALDKKLLMSGHPANVPLAKITNPEIIKSGEWVLFHPMSTAAVGPWGTSFAANLTPDETGIGSWSYEQFEKAIREGKSKGMEGTRPILPPMPWFNYAKMEDADLRAIFAYLMSLPKVNNIVPNPIPPTVL